MSTYNPVAVAEDADRRTLAAQYQTAVDRLQNIEDSAGGMDLNQARAALGDLAQIQRRMLQFLRKSIQKE